MDSTDTTEKLISKLQSAYAKARKDRQAHEHLGQAEARLRLSRRIHAQARSDAFATLTRYTINNHTSYARLTDTELLAALQRAEEAAIAESNQLWSELWKAASLLDHAIKELAANTRRALSALAQPPRSIPCDSTIFRPQSQASTLQERT